MVSGRKTSVIRADVERKKLEWMNIPRLLPGCRHC